ncbi:hypothetical protein BZARG_03490 [Bizionia argentinensis JUB59]|uniref:Signal peptidase n=1 Tax=Bizionia argentinensis JUB59 TaxID=1046627 RepID=A0A4U8UIU1_9FLAO|nr:hypothetical protein [Bizionia argentinensis]TLG99012.1 hypothetical protein BZARG_03490 [Bizionia argentinensis JUB59]
MKTQNIKILATILFLLISFVCFSQAAAPPPPGPPPPPGLPIDGGIFSGLILGAIFGAYRLFKAK